MTKHVLFALIVLRCIAAHAQTPTLVKDINPGSSLSNYSLNGIIYNNSFIFPADDGTHGRELWITDGTTGGTSFLKDINPGSDASDPVDFLIFNNVVYFTAYSTANGRELWKTDGTSAGTVMVKDIIPGSTSGFVDYNGTFGIQLRNVWEKNGSFFFIANSDNSINYNNDIELWKTDGTSGGTVRVKDIQPGTEGSHPHDFMVFNNTLYFVAYTVASGEEMWKSDGSDAGTIMVKDIYPGSNSAFVDYNGYFTITLLNVWEKNGSFYFIANTDNSVNYNNNIELWKTDGTAAGTVQVKDIQPGTEGSHPYDFLVFNNSLYFIAYTVASGSEMWKTDGTGAGTVMVKDIYPGSNSGFVDYNGYFSIRLKNVWEKNGSFYFIANTDNSVNYNNNIELWKTDGTTAGTVQVKDIQPGNEGSHPEDFFVFNNTLFFAAYTISSGTEMWKTDGTSGGTVMVKDIFPGANSGFVDYNGTAYFGLHNVFEKNGSFYFKANNDNSNAADNNVELWKSDGTAAGTVIVKEIQPGTDGSHPAYFNVFNNQLFFTTFMASQGSEIWKSDGTAGGTVLLKDIQSGSGSGVLNFYPLFTYGSNMYFHAYQLGTSDHEIWKTDGTTGNTVKVLDINPGANGSYSNSFVLLPNDNMIFIADDGTHGDELWVMHLPGFTSAEEINAMDFSVFPNPVVNGNLTVTTSDANNEIAAMELFDVYGKIVFSKPFFESGAHQISISLPTIARGIYYLRMVNSSNAARTKKIIIEN